MNYAIPLALLVVTILAFVWMGRGGYAEFGTTQFILRVVVALPLLVSGVFLHFFRVAATASIILPRSPRGSCSS